MPDPTRRRPPGPAPRCRRASARAVAALGALLLASALLPACGPQGATEAAPVVWDGVRWDEAVWQ